MRNFDVAVVGGGPAGSCTAIMLARLGHAVVLLDRARFPRHKLCGDFLNPINWALLEDLGVADAVRKCEHVKISRFSLSSVSNQKTAASLPLRDALHSGLGIQRYFLDNVLVNRAKNAGVTVEEGCNVVGISRETAGWSIRCRSSEGDEIRRARLLVAADGRHSKVARQLKLDAALPPHGAVGFQMRLKLLSGVENSVQLYQFPGGYAGVVRLDAETVNVGFTIEQSDLCNAKSFQALRKNYLDQNVALRDLLFKGQPCSKMRSIWPVYLPARRRYGEGYVLVGDAAQATEPITGEGIYFALKSGALAARTLSAALYKGKFSRFHLAPYESACIAEFSTRTRLNRWLRLIIRHPTLLAASIYITGRRKTLFDAVLRRVCDIDQGAQQAAPLD